MGQGKFRVRVVVRVSLGLRVCPVRVIVRVRISVVVRVSNTQHF